jgi:response regulator of citrate/malate metabolism
MTAVERNYTWVKDHAFNIARRKKGIAKGMFTVGEVVNALGFARNTVQKYVDMLEANEIVYKVIISKKLVAYRFHAADVVVTRDVQDIPF